MTPRENSPDQIAQARKHATDRPLTEGAIASAPAGSRAATPAGAAEEAPAGRGAAARLRRWLGSADLALWLLGVLVVAMAVGTVVPQQAASRLPLEAYTRPFGPALGGLIARTSLVNVFNSWWFIGAFALLALNLAACSVQRLGMLLRPQRDVAPVSADLIRGQRVNAQFSTGLAPAAATARLSAALRRRGYRVAAATTKEKDGAGLRARRGAVRAWGPVAVHVGLIVVLIGAAYGHLPHLFYSETPLIGQGESYHVDFGPTAFDIRLLGAGTELGPDGSATAYWANTQVVRDGKVVRSARISPNHPLRYEGANVVLQSVLSGGYAVEVTKGAAVGRVPVAMDRRGAVDMMASMTRLEDPRWLVFVHDFSRSHRPGEGAGGVTNAETRPRPAARVFVDESGKMSPNWRPVGWVDETGRSYKGVHFRLVAGGAGAQLGIFRDVGVPIVWAGFAVVVAGCLLALLVTRRDITVLVTPRAGGARVLLGARAHGFGPAGDSVMNSLGAEVVREEVNSA
jgi:cytochrome c biogenesis protein